MTDTVLIENETGEDTGYKFSWGLAFAGAVAATAVTFFLLTIGAGFGLLLAGTGHSPGDMLPVFLTGGGIYFFAAQAFGFAVGGHIAGRLLGSVVETRRQEDVRAGIHGLIVWAITVVASLLLVAFAATQGGGMAALYGAGHAQAATPVNYLVDKLYTPSGDTAPPGARQEAARILGAGLARGASLGREDHARLADLVAHNAGISQSAAMHRIDAMQTRLQAQAKNAAKAASFASLWIGFSLLFGLIVAVFAAVSARVEDDRETVRGPAANPLRPAL